MNNARRKKIKSIIADFTEATGSLSVLQSKLSDILSEVDTLRDEEQEAFDAMPEGLQNSERGQAAEASISSLVDVYEQLDNLLYLLYDLTVKELLESACA